MFWDCMDGQIGLVGGRPLEKSDQDSVEKRGQEVGNKREKLGTTQSKSRIKQTTYDWGE